MGTNIRQAKLYDVPAISRIEQESFDSPWSADEITKDVMSKDGSIYVAVIESDGEKAGYAEMRTVAGEAQIYNIVIDRTFRGKGLGEMLLRHLIDKAKETGCSLVTLEVRGGNEAAMELYHKLGFKEVGRRKGYYIKGGEDAVLMDLALGGFEITVEV
ncbi:MAG: ribosomal protein S18-alanine N-acetyltransferase [Mogibacterium sp.]|nr:ribosomal protein S18-alanine N-acetyltransferase [Mogibacterium sp.]